MIKNIVIINDIRPTPIFAALTIKSSLDNSELIIHESHFDNVEYGDLSNKIWKLLVKYFLKKFTKIKIIKRSEFNLYSNELVGLYSSLISITEDSEANQQKYNTLFNQLKNLACGSKDIINYLSSNYPIENITIILFNGRTASSYLISKYCSIHNIKIYYYEFAAHCNGFRIFSIPVHASEKIGSLILNYYKIGLYSKTSLKKSTYKFIDEKLNSDFSKKNKNDPLEKYDVAIFLGSDFEYTSIDKDICGVEWNGSVNFCEKVINKYGNKSYVIRMHPNSARDPAWSNLFEELTKKLKTLNCKFKIISPIENIDSHKLILNSSLTVSDLSSISLDAILLNKKVDIFGKIDFKYIYENPWMIKYSGKFMSNIVAEPFALRHNFLVFRYGLLKKFFCIFLFYIHRFLEKINNKIDD